MPTIYLHIGTMKTATSALQSFLKNHPEELALRKAIYPVIPGIQGNPNARFWQFRGLKEEAKTKALRKVAYELLDEAVKKYDKILLSTESFWNIEVKKKRFWKTVKKYCESRGCDLKIVVYLRNQIDYAQSYYIQKIKAKKYTKSFAESISDEKLTDANYDYAATLDYVSEQVGKDNVIVRVFEPEQMVNSNIVEDFYSISGMEFPAELYEEAVKIKNYSLEGDYIEAKLRLNRDESTKELEPELTKVLRDMNAKAIEEARPPKTQMETSEFLLDFMSQYEDGNARIAREYLGREDGVLFKRGFRELPVYNPDEENVNKIIAKAVEKAKKKKTANASK